jgi:hypothetical protein
MKPNTNFTLTVKDIAHIEHALTIRLNEVSGSEESSEIYDLLGRLYNQKAWYRPSKGVYISG